MSRWLRCDKKWAVLQRGEPVKKEWPVTARLRLRQLEMADAPKLQPILQDTEVMYAWEHAFSEREVTEWLLENLRRYETDGYSYLAAETEGGALAGVTGLLTEHVNGKPMLGIGWIFDKRFWGQGYAREGAEALLQYAFQVLGAGRVIAEIRPENLPSRRLAERLGMRQTGSFCKIYCGKPMEHLIYELTRPGHVFCG